MPECSQLMEVWIREHQSLVIPRVDLFTAVRLHHHGWSMVWDSCPSEIVGSTYAWRFHKATVPVEMEEALKPLSAMEVIGGET